jgi:hypothetical protein
MRAFSDSVRVRLRARTGTFSRALCASCTLKRAMSGCGFWIQVICTFTLILQRAKLSKYHQTTKIQFGASNYQISAVSTPIFATKAPFFSIFRNLPDYLAENAAKFQKLLKTFAPKFAKSGRNRKKFKIAIFL